jgi:hypothetical protein
VTGQALPRRCLLTVALALTLLLSADAGASQSASLHVSLTPEHLGGRTTILFDIQIASAGAHVPSPLTAVNLLYPKDVGLITTGLGLQTCSATQLESRGRCPANSLMGYGQALIEFPIGPEVIEEHGEITTWMAPAADGHLTLLFYAEGQSPVSASLIFTSQLLDAPAPFGGELATDIPLIPTLPEAPNAAIVHLTTTIGPMNVTYHRQFRGKSTAYHPRGIRLPRHCPHGGFPFAATFTFSDGAHSSARTTVPCPAAKPPPASSAAQRAPGCSARSCRA